MARITPPIDDAAGSALTHGRDTRVTGMHAGDMGVPHKPEARCGTSIARTHWPGNTSAAGFTLIEAMIASVVLGIAVIGVAGLMACSSQQAQYTQETSVAVTLARQLLEEISAKPLLEPSDGSRHLGPEADETSRTLFDNVDDYYNYYDTTGAIKTAGGDWYTTLGDGQIYKRKVTVIYRSAPAGPADPAGDFALVTVTVTTPGGQNIVLNRLMCKGNFTM